MGVGMNEIKVGDRVRCYFDPYANIPIHEIQEILPWYKHGIVKDCSDRLLIVMHDDYELHRYHRKQCRKLVKKKKCNECY